MTKLKQEVENAQLCELVVQSHHRLKKAKREFCNEVAYQMVVSSNGYTTVADIRRSFAAMGNGILSQDGLVVETALSDLAREHRVTGRCFQVGGVFFDCAETWNLGFDEERTYVTAILAGVGVR